MEELDLTPEKALIFRVTHRDNLPLILEDGLICQTWGLGRQNFTPIGNPGIIDDRRRRLVEVDPHGTLSDYVPLYFTPVTPMMLNIVTGRGVPRRNRQELIVLVSSLNLLGRHGIRFVYTDRKAFDIAAVFTGDDDLSKLENLPWAALRAMNFQRNLNDPESFDRYMAEALVHQHLPVARIAGLGVYDDGIRKAIEGLLCTCSCKIRVVVRPRWFC